MRSPFHLMADIYPSRTRAKQTPVKPKKGQRALVDDGPLE
jgi:hypothetical protein